MHLRTPWWWASEDRNVWELTCYNITVILTNCVHLSAYTELLKQVLRWWMNIIRDVFELRLYSISEARFFFFERFITKESTYSIFEDQLQNYSPKQID